MPYTSHSSKETNFKICKNFLWFIREASEKNWHVKIQDAILEKCGPNHNIVHIVVDKLSQEVSKM